MGREVDTLLKKEAIEVVPPHERESRFYSRHFIVPKKDGGCIPPITSHYASVEPLSQQTEVQDAHTPTGRVSDQVRGLVCLDRSGRCILPCLHTSHSQGVPEVCFRGRSLPISGYSFGLALSPRTFTKGLVPH